MMKTPDEIKKGLVCCIENNECKYCPYLGNCNELEEDALDYIKQLETELEAVKRERDALLSDLSQARNCCRFCKHDAVYTSECDECKHGSNFEWRGLCKENGGVEDDKRL